MTVNVTRQPKREQNLKGGTKGGLAAKVIRKDLPVQTGTTETIKKAAPRLMLKNENLTFPKRNGQGKKKKGRRERNEQ